jgi:hypothetical protein
MRIEEKRFKVYSSAYLKKAASLQKIKDRREQQKMTAAAKSTTAMATRRSRYGESGLTESGKDNLA